jgi:gluconate 2-dehydrogenase gamma chain
MTDITRRDVVAGLASVPAALLIPADGLERAAAHAADAIELEQGTPAQQPRPYQPKNFSTDEWRFVRSLVDYVIPRDARSGSANDAGVPQFMDFILGEYTNNRQWMRDGISWMNAECRRRFDNGWMSCSDAERKLLLDDIAYPARAAEALKPGADFFTRFRNLTSSGFWSSRIGVADLGYVGNRPVAKWEGTPANVLTWLERRR